MHTLLHTLVAVVLGCLAATGEAMAACNRAHVAAPGDTSACGIEVAEAATKEAQADTEAGTAYHVGPGQKYAAIGDVPWFSVKGGDTVYIHYRPQPYREKFLISGRGSPSRWIRVLGVPGPNGELPMISGDGAVTSKNMHYRWQNPNDMQLLGIIQIAVAYVEDGHPKLPGYIEIANLKVQDGGRGYRFTAENGASVEYDKFTACIYARSAQHILIHDNVLSNCGLGFYNWTGDGSKDVWWVGLQRDTVIRGNHFFNNGVKGSYTEHQIYTESDGVIIEGNRFGPMREGALGSQIKDRSAGTVIRYNYIEQAPAGWDIDLVEPEESAPSLLRKEEASQAFVYGNLVVNTKVRYPNFFHWNEDHQAGKGRATIPGAKLFFYNNTVVTHVDRWQSEPVTFFNATWGGYECPPGALPGVIDLRNNIFTVVSGAFGGKLPPIRFGYCGKENFEFGANWVTTGTVVHGAKTEGWRNVVAPGGNDPGFEGPDDFRLRKGASASGIGAVLAPEVASNKLKIDLTPRQRYVPHQRLEPRPAVGAGSDLGAY